MMQYNSYTPNNDYGSVQKYERADYSSYTHLEKKAQLFKGKIVNVFATQGNYGLQWQLTIVNDEKRQKLNLYVSAESTSRLAQQILLITTNGLESHEKIVEKDGKQYCFIDNVKGEIVVSLAYFGQTKTDLPAFKAFAFFYPNGASIEEGKECQNLNDWKKSLSLVKQATEEYLKMNHNQANPYAPQNQPQPQIQQPVNNPIAQPQPQMQVQKPNPFEIQGQSFQTVAPVNNEEDDIPF